MFFTKQKSGEVTLIIDIGSSSVGAALVSVSENLPPKILFSLRLPVTLQNESERGRSLTAITQALESVMKSAIAEHIVFHKSHIIFSSPWYVSSTKNIVINNDKPKLITHHHIAQLTKDAEKEMVEKSATKGKVVERRVIHARLNGYNATNPYHKKVKNLEITFFVSLVAQYVLDAILNIVEKHFHIRNNQISSFSLAAWSAISGILPDEHDYLIVDVRGEVTDVSLVADGAMVKSLSFPQGKNALVQAVADHSDHSPVAALSLLNTALHDNGAPATRDEVIKFSNDFKQTWTQVYAKTLQEFSPDGQSSASLPTEIILLADPDVEIFFENTLNEMSKTGSLRTLKHLKVRNYVETSSVLTDQFLALESIFVTMM